MQVVDINCDIGESFGNWAMPNDAELFPIITSASIACGFHAGDPLTMDATVRRARASGSVIGAHPGLPDLVGFGRRVMDVSPEDVYSMILYQVGALDMLARSQGLKVEYVKPHGALETVLESSPECARAAVEAISKALPLPRIYWRASVGPDPFSQAAMAAGFDVVWELYPDLSYLADGTNVIERQKQAKDPRQVALKVKQFLADGTVSTIEGELLALEAQTICVHSDGPNAVELAQAIRSAVEESGWTVRAPDERRSG